MIRRPARNHPRYRPSLRRASTRRASPVCITSARSYVRTRVCVLVTRVFTRCPSHPYRCWSGRSCTVSHGPHVSVTAHRASLTSSSRRRRRWPTTMVMSHLNCRETPTITHCWSEGTQTVRRRSSRTRSTPSIKFRMLEIPLTQNSSLILLPFCDRITRFSRSIPVDFIVGWNIVGDIVGI